MGLGYITAGIIFLFNPNLHVFDFLPDFIGVLLIYRGLFKMSFSTEKLRDTRTALWKLAIVTAARAASILFLPGTTDSFTLLLVFTFGVLEALYTIPAVLTAFDGFYDLGRRYDAQSVYARRKDAKGVITERAEKLKIFTVIFFLIKTVGSILPELTALQLRQEFSADAQYRVFLSDFKPYFYFLAFVITLVFGIVWLTRALRYVDDMKRDRNLTEGVAAHYRDNVENDAGVMAALQMKNVQLMFLLAALSTFPIQFDGVSVLPSLVPVLILCLAFRILSRMDRLAKFGCIPAAITVVLSAANLGLQIPYFAEYDAEAGRFLNNAIRLYKTIRLVGPFEYVCAAATFGWFVFILFRVVRQHAALVGGSIHAPQYSAASRTAEILYSVNGRLLAVSIVGVIYFILRAVSFTAQMYYPAYWLIPVIACIVFVAVVIYAVAGANALIYERLENKY